VSASTSALLELAAAVLPGMSATGRSAFTATATNVRTTTSNLRAAAPDLRSTSSNLRTAAPDLRAAAGTTTAERTRLLVLHQWPGRVYLKGGLQ